MKQIIRKISNLKKQITKKIQISNMKPNPFVFFFLFCHSFFGSCFLVLLQVDVCELSLFIYKSIIAIF